MSGTRYEVRSGDGLVWRFPKETTVPYFRRFKAKARRLAQWLDREHWGCGPHRVWSVDSDGTQTDITDESETT